MRNGGKSTEATKYLQGHNSHVSATSRRRRNDVVTTLFVTGYFSLFFTGGCKDYTDVFTCENNRCISNEFVCLDINPCGDNSDCPTLQEAISFWQSIIESIQNIIVIVVVIGAVYIAFSFFKHVRQRGTNLKDLPVIGCLLDSNRADHQVKIISESEVKFYGTVKTVQVKSSRSVNFHFSRAS